ncbi:MAG: HD domain-containing protein [Bacteroidaceae bacterium]|nr:HD domain-containing protein [Bacteroidaceae bacterium]
MNVNRELVSYIEAEILPRYDLFDRAHRRPHAEMVIHRSLKLAEQLNANADMAYTIAAYHDTGLAEGREHHHKVSARIIRNDPNLRRWFSEEEINIMANAAEDHRASADRPPRTLYGRIVADADRFINPESIIRRTILYGLDHYPTLSREEHFQRMADHLRKKYGRGGYLHLWVEQSDNAYQLEQLRLIIDKEELMRQWFDKLWEQLPTPSTPL